MLLTWLDLQVCWLLWLLNFPPQLCFDGPLFLCLDHKMFFLSWRGKSIEMRVNFFNVEVFSPSFFHLPLPWLAKVTHQRQQMALPWCSSLPVDIFEIYYQNFNWKQNSLYFRKWIRTFIITKNIPIRNEISSELKCLASLDFHV